MAAVCRGASVARRAGGVARAGRNVPRSVAAAAARPSWAPGAEIPAYLDGSLPGDYGFDPLKLGETNLDRLVECELLHARWCMLATAGCLAVELGGYGTWIEAAQWPVSGAPLTYFGNEVPINLGAVVAIEVLSMAYLEVARNGETDPVKRCYPGGPFDPLGLSKDADYFMTMKKKEIANGRLAMFALLGYWGQAAATGAGPVADWKAHIADPWHVNAATNIAAVPFRG